MTPVCVRSPWVHSGSLLLEWGPRKERLRANHSVSSQTAWVSGRQDATQSIEYRGMELLERSRADRSV